MGEEDGHLLQFGLGEFPVEQRGVDLDLGQVAISDRGHRRQRHDALVAHRQSRSGPDAAEQVIDGQVEVRVALDVGHLPSVDLVHLLEALAAQLVHLRLFLCMGHTEAGGQALVGHLSQRQVDRYGLTQR